MKKGGKGGGGKRGVRIEGTASEPGDVSEGDMADNGELYGFRKKWNVHLCHLDHPPSSNSNSTNNWLCDLGRIINHSVLLSRNNSHHHHHHHYS